VSPGPLDEVESRARQRFHRFSTRAWERWLERGARPLAERLAQAPGWTDAEREAVLSAAAGLGAEAVGLGYLHVPVAGAEEGWCWHALGPLLAGRLPPRAPREALAELAALWNLAEALERSPPWVRNLVSHFAPHLAPGTALPDFVRAVDDALGEEGLLPLGSEPSRWTAAWRPLAPGASEWVPGRVAFLAPRVVAVEHQGTGQASFFWLTPEPVPLGTGPWEARGWAQAPFPRLQGHAGWLQRQRAGPLHAEARTAHAWVGTPRLSQRVLFAWRAA
jgi:hypothetical protein